MLAHIDENRTLFPALDKTLMSMQPKHSTCSNTDGVFNSIVFGNTLRHSFLLITAKEMRTLCQ